MTKAQTIKYILKSQESLDDRVQEEFPDIPYTKEQLHEMSAKEVKEKLEYILLAEAISEAYYEAEYIKHGRSE
jgi:hypothetical protein